MAITIKQRGEKWRMIIQEEELEFEDREKLDKNLKIILDLKQEYGGLKQ